MVLVSRAEVVVSCSNCNCERNEMDRVSNLPDSLIDLILDKLATVDRVKTTILSRSWRSRRPVLTTLNLDMEFHYSIDRPAGDIREIIETVAWQQGGGGSLKEFCLYVRYDRDAVDDDDSSVKSYHSAIDHVVTKNSGLQVLRLQGDWGRRMTRSSIFSLVNLRHLEVRDAVFIPPPEFEGFPKLTIFELEKTTAEPDEISRFISVCPQLEQVSIRKVCFIGHNLLFLEAPNLTRLWVQGHYMNLFVSNPRNLKSICLDFYSRERIYISYGALGSWTSSASQLEFVELNGGFCEVLAKDTALHMLPIFDRIYSLRFYDLNLNDPAQLRCLLKFCACSPNIKELYLKTQNLLTTPSSIDPPELESACYIKDDLGKLVRVELIDIKGFKVEMKMIELLLCYSPMLEVMDIVLDPKASEAIKATVMNFYRASTEAKINFIHPHP